MNMNVFIILVGSIYIRIEEIFKNDLKGLELIIEIVI